MKKISPNLFIYKFPIAAISSVTNRITGVYLTNIFLFGGLACLFNYDKLLIDNYNVVDKNIKKCIDYSIIFSGTYHTLGGIRHFIWDKFPELLTKSNVSLHSKLLFGITIPTTYIIEKIL
tara:strand:+ start:15306 stop:15665 length:360 start_codon:yes stop_codon:yes gene_type:complete